MTQRVSIQYSIDLDNLEMETDRLMQGIRNQVEELTTQLEPACPTLSIQSVENLSVAQQKLHGLSIAVDDLQKIISGYLSFKLQPEQPPPPEEELSVPDGNIDSAPLNSEQRNNLREQLSEYRRVLEHAVSLQEPDQEIVDEELKRQKIESFKNKHAAHDT